MPEQKTGSNDARRDLERHIGQIVRKLRRQQNLTIAEIARKAQISSGMLSKIENSQTSASLDTLVSLANALGATMASLFIGFSSEQGGAQHVKSGQAPEVVRRGTKRGHTYHLLAIELYAGTRRRADVSRQRAAWSGKAHQAADQDARDHHLRRRDGTARNLNVVFAAGDCERSRACSISSPSRYSSPLPNSPT
jgi:transcriptional regulator with XRE-family HTH domain